MTTAQLKYIAEISAFTERQIQINTGLKVKIDVKGLPILREGLADPEDMVKSMAEAMGFFPQTLKERGRKREVVLARNACIYILRRYFPRISLTAIGKMFSKDHSDIIYSISSVENDFNNKNEQFISLYVKAERAAEEWYERFKKEVLCGEE